MLEWYRRDGDLAALMKDATGILAALDATMPSRTRRDRQGQRFRVNRKPRVRTWAQVMLDEAGLDVNAFLSAADEKQRVKALCDQCEPSPTGHQTHGERPVSGESGKVPGMGYAHFITPRQC